MPNKIVTLNPVDVQKHWTRKLLPQPSQERVDALSNELARGTKLPPGYLIEPNLLVAGETRRLAHKARQTDMDFIVITEEEALNIAFGENTNRQSYKFKYQIAFIYCPLAAKVVAESSKRKGFGHATAIKSNIGLYGGPESLDDVADLIGVSRSLMADAKKTYDDLILWDKENKHKKWGEDKSAKTALDYWTGRIMDQEGESCTPGQARAGLAGSDAGAQGKTKPVPKQLELFCAGLESVGKWSKSFNQFEGESKKLALNAVKKTIAAMPPELRTELATEIKRLEREEKESLRS